MSLETMIAVKFGKGLYTKPWPHSVVVSWAVAGTVFAVVLSIWQLLIWLGNDGKVSSTRGAGSGARRKPLFVKQL